MAFLSTLSLRRATQVSPRSFTVVVFLSTLSLRRATPAGLDADQGREEISIHALLAESDREKLYDYLRNDISIHALLAESDDNAQPAAARAVIISIHALLAESDSKSAQNSGTLLHI